MIRVIVADDQPLVRAGLSTMLGIEPDIEVVAQATDGAQAVEAASTGRYDAVLMDCEMPVVDGFSATALLRAAGIDVPIIAMTGHVREEDRERCLQAGMNDHLAKPIERSALEGVISRWLPTGAAPNGTSAS